MIVTVMVICFVSFALAWMLLRRRDRTGGERSEKLEPLEPWSTETLRIETNYELPMAVIIALGLYNDVDQDIYSDDFTTTRTGVHELVANLIEFDGLVSSERVVRSLDAIGMRPGELHELLSVGSSHLRLNKRFPIVALGSPRRNPSDGQVGVPCLGCITGLRTVGIYYPRSIGWGEGVRFLAFDKDAPPIKVG